MGSSGHLKFDKNWYSCGQVGACDDYHLLQIIFIEPLSLEFSWQDIYTFPKRVPIVGPWSLSGLFRLSGSLLGPYFIRRSVPNVSLSKLAGPWKFKEQWIQFVNSEEGFLEPFLTSHCFTLFSANWSTLPDGSLPWRQILKNLRLFAIFAWVTAMTMPCNEL